MPPICISRWFIPICSNVTVLISFIFAIIVAALLFTIGLFSISRKLLISMLVLMVSIALTGVLTIFSAITYFYFPDGANEQMQKSIFTFKKRYLLIINTLFLIVLGAISFSIYSFRNDFLDFIGQVFNDYYNNDSKRSSEKFVKYMENYFKCKYYDLDSPSGNCAEFITKFINSNSKIFSIFLGIISIIFLILLIIGIYFDSKSKSDNGPGSNNDRSESANFDINQELNPNVATDF